MSCLLYNLAIEPLATALRSSTKLKGIKIENHAKLITKLFSDDALVYLGKNDKFSDLEEIINCSVMRPQHASIWRKQKHSQ